MQKDVTIKDIALQTKFSVNTVSRALRNMPDISKRTKAAILAKAKEMGYKKNFMASTLRTNKSHIIGVIMPDIKNPIYGGIYKGIESVSNKNGYTLFLANSNEKAAEEKREINAMLSHMVDGIILCPTMENTENFEFLRNSTTPFVLVGRTFAGKPANSVVNNDKRGGYLACEHLISKGHHSFLYLTGPLYISSCIDRRDGFLQCMNEHNIPESRLKVSITNPTVADAYTAMRALLEEGFNKRAIFAFSDFMALGVLKALREFDIAVPEQVAVIGYDDLEFCDLTTPGLTSIDLYKYRLGVCGMELMLEVLQKKQGASDKQIVLEPSLIVRGSV